jgi:hypothetical protein
VPQHGCVPPVIPRPAPESGSPLAAP